MAVGGAGGYPRCVAFDLDGTLLSRTTVSLYLAERLGQTAALDGLEQAFVSGRISSRVIADASAAGYAGRTVAEITGLLEEAPWIRGLAPAVATLREAGTAVLVATITWRFAAEFLRRRHGFDAVCGTPIEIEGDVVTGRVARYFEEQDKRDFVTGWCADNDVQLRDVVAVGDSRSDLPLFAAVGRSVALNATRQARAAATDALDTDDLRDVLPLLRRGASGAGAGV